MTAFDELRTDAPGHLIDEALVAAGVADGYVTRPSPLGPLHVAFGSAGVTAIDLAESSDDFERRYAHTHDRRVIGVRRAPESIDRHLDRAIESGTPGRLPLDFSGLTEFQSAVLRSAASIPRGQVRPYGWIAREIGRPGAARAVGSALAGNPVPVVVPCHRVVRSDGRLGQYSLGGAGNKRRLLEAEGLDVDEYEALAQRGIRFVGSDTTHVFCQPTCGHARRIGDSHRVGFHSETDALAEGYRPCKVCRPVAA